MNANSDKHVYADGCIYERDITIIDKYVQRAYRWVIFTVPILFTSTKVECEEDDWVKPLKKRSASLDWIRYAQSFIVKIKPMFCPLCHQPGP